MENAINIILTVIGILVLIFMFEKGSNDNHEINFKQFRKNDGIIKKVSNIIERHRVTINWPTVQSFDPEYYPIYNNLYDILKNWNPDSPDIPFNTFNETLQHFNYSNILERNMAEAYRNNEMPFKLYNIPEIDKVINKWDDEYLIKNMKQITPHIEESNTNHFMFWNTKSGTRKISDYKPPTKVINIPFNTWLDLAYQADIDLVNETMAHYYYMIGTTTSQTKNFVVKDLDIFSTKENNYFITDVSRNKGIQCRFGMRGIIAEAHYDSGRNMVAMIKGHKRYILAPPKMCKKLGIISDMNHPSYRHSVIDWSDLNQAKSYNFDKVLAIDTIVRQGEILYIPSYWFHYIISLEYSVQCNSRSGTPPNKQGEDDITQCLGNASTKKKK